jgi:FAD/FMN-containing dehydrogenase
VIINAGRYNYPFDIIKHLLISPEGTLGFIAEITYLTVLDPPHKATALVFFPDIGTACAADMKLPPNSWTGSTSGRWKRSRGCLCT